MTDQELNSTIYRTLANQGDWVTFDQLDQMLAKAAPDWRDEVRRSMLRGELGRMIRSGQVIRDRYTAKYHISEEVNLF